MGFAGLLCLLWVYVGLVRVVVLILSVLRFGLMR